MKKLIALSLALLLLCSCGTQNLHMEEYPRVEPSANYPAPQTLTVVLPDDADEVLESMILLLDAKIRELSGGNITLNVTKSSQRLGCTTPWDLMLYTTDDLVAAREEMAFLTAPFLFPSRETFLTVASQPDGVVRGNVRLQNALEGEIVAVYYGGAMGFLCRGRLYDEIGFLESPVGILEDGELGADFYATLPEMEAKSVTVGDNETLRRLIAEEELRYAEAPRSEPVPDDLTDTVRYYEDTQHRFFAYWLVTAAHMDPMVQTIICEAASYTISQQNQQRLNYEDDNVAAMPSSNHPDGYPTLYRKAFDLYRREETRLILDEELWQELAAFLQ